MGTEGKEIGQSFSLMWLYSLETKKKVTIHVLVPENLTGVNSGGESRPKRHRFNSRKSELLPNLQGWHVSQVSENTKTTFPRTQQILHKLIGHIHYRVIVIFFNQFVKTSTYVFPKAQAVTYKHILCFFILMILMVDRPCLGKRGKLFCIIQLAVSM